MQSSQLNRNRYDYSGLIQKKFNMLTVLSVEKIGGKTMLKCECECKNICYRTPYQVKSGHCQSCGCLRAKTANRIRGQRKNDKPRYIDGRSSHPLHGTWKQMIDRCENPNANHYDRYGGRGIKVCEEWHDFWRFVSWSDSIGGRPNGYTLDRMDNDAGYCPENCRWASWDNQSNNKSNNLILSYRGKTLTLKQWSNLTGISHQTLINRYRRGWSTERIIETAPKPNKGNKTRFLPVIQMDKDGNIVSKHENISSIPNGYSKKCISECCNGRKKTYKGYAWKYEGE